MAAEKGYSEAQFNLAQCYTNGIGVEKDEKEAAKWYKKAAEQGNEVAQYYWGVCCYNGTGVKQDKEEARKWFQKSADQDYGPAKVILRIFD